MLAGLMTAQLPVSPGSASLRAVGIWHRIFYGLCAGCLGASLAGCEPSSSGTADDEKEPHFVLGQNRVNAMDFPGAVDAFEASLEANPHSAAAHYQLAWIYENKETNAAAAIYHYQQYLKFNPKAPNAEVITGRINNCKQQLADAMFPSPNAAAMQQQLQQLMDRNRQLQEQVAYYAGLAALKTNSMPAPGNHEPQPGPTSVPATTVVANPPPTKPRKHTVAAGETPAAIARKYGVNVNALLVANPGVEPRKLRVGQVLNLPAP